MKKLILYVFIFVPIFANAQYGKEVVTSPTTNVYVFLGSLPADGGGNYAKLKVDILGGAWEAYSSGETSYYIANRGSLTISQVTSGSTNAGRYSLHAYNNTSGGIDFYLLTSGYTAIAVKSCMLGGTATQLINNTTSANLPAGLTEILPLNIVPVMITDQNGNVGIGTTDPKGYKLAVAGNMIAEQVNVKLQANWPDYVFKKSYNLTSLSDLKTYIDQNHHLPEVPSAQDVAKDGLNLGEMNKILVKKVEELTLYLIEKDKEIEVQKKIVEGQNARLKLIEQQLGIK